MAEFPKQEDGDLYSSPYLFSTFIRRIPSPDRPDRVRLLEKWGVHDSDNLLEILAKSGGLLLTDRIELSEYRSRDDDLARPLDVRIAASAYYSEEDAKLRVGCQLKLRLEQNNPEDPDAVKLELLDDGKVGYIPKQYSGLIARHLRAGASLQAEVTRQLLVPASSSPWVVQLSRAT